MGANNWRDQGEMSVWLQSYSLKAQLGCTSDDCADFADATVKHCRERRPVDLSIVSSNRPQ